MKSLTAIIPFVCLVAFFQSCYSTKCYHCNSYNADCSKDVNDKYIRNCPENLSCGLVVFDKKNYSFIERGCEPKGSQYVLETCNSDKCNGGKESNTTYNEGDTLKCYSCSSGIHYHDEKCKNIVNDDYLNECEAGEICSSLKFIDSDKNIIFLIRSCESKTFKIDSQTHCDTDQCNGKIQEVSTKYEKDFSSPETFKNKRIFDKLF